MTVRNTFLIICSVSDSKHSLFAVFVYEASVGVGDVCKAADAASWSDSREGCRCRRQISNSDSVCHWLALCQLLSVDCITVIVPGMSITTEVDRITGMPAIDIIMHCWAKDA